MTTLMITHNMRDALRCGNRLIMLHNGRVIIDVEGEEKSRLTIPDLLKMFEQASGDMLDSDRLLLSKIKGGFLMTPPFTLLYFSKP